MRSYDSTLPPIDERRPFLDRTYDDEEGRSYQSIRPNHSEEEPGAPPRFFLLLSAGFFLASSVAVLLTQNHTTTSTSMHNSRPIELLGKAQQQQPQPQQQQVRSTTNSSSASTLSTRGQSIHPGRDDLIAFQTAAADAYSPRNNTDGYLVMLVAENRLMHHELAAKLQDVTTSSASKNHTVTIPEWVFDYGDMRGQADFKQAVAQMMESSWLQAPVDPNALVLQSGAGSILDSLAWILADAGDGVIVTAPAYPAFASDLGTRGRLHLHTAPTAAQHNYEPTVADLDQAYARAVEAGHPPKILLICQPHNPTGAVYSHAAMERMITWALRKKRHHPRMHVVSDEIYGNSHFPGVHVTSAAQIMHELQQQQQTSDDNSSYLGDYVHVVAGLSKDFGMSGFRVGSLLTHNAALLEAMGTVGYYSSVSQYTQWALTALLQDTVWREWYLAENQRRLQATFRAAEEALGGIGVTVFPATLGGMFAWADFSALLQPNQTETDLWRELFHEAKVLFTTGESCFGDKPGMFRVVYSWPDGGEVAMRELGRRLVRWKADRE